MKIGDTNGNKGELSAFVAMISTHTRFRRQDRDPVSPLRPGVKVKNEADGLYLLTYLCHPVSVTRCNKIRAGLYLRQSAMSQSQLRGR